MLVNGKAAKNGGKNYQVVAGNNIENAAYSSDGSTSTTPSAPTPAMAWKGIPPGSVESLGYSGPETIAAFPPIILDALSTDLRPACDPRDGNDLLAHYSRLRHGLRLGRDMSAPLVGPARLEIREGAIWA